MRRTIPPTRTHKKTGDGKDAPDDPEEEPGSKGPEEDTQPPGEQTSSGEDQYSPETDGERDPETTTAAG
jgi:hypothetical protein